MGAVMVATLAKTLAKLVVMALDAKLLKLRETEP
jgi:hypothetical protein